MIPNESAVFSLLCLSSFWHANVAIASRFCLSLCCQSSFFKLLPFLHGHRAFLLVGLFFFFSLNGSLDIIPNPSNPWTWCLNALGDFFFLEELVPVITVTCVFIFVKMVFSTAGCQLTPGPLHPCCSLCVWPCTACLDADLSCISDTHPAPPHAHQPTHI